MEDGCIILNSAVCNEAGSMYNDEPTWKNYAASDRLDQPAASRFATKTADKSRAKELIMPKRRRTSATRTADKIVILILATTVSLAPGVWASAEGWLTPDTLRLTDEQEFQPVSDEPTSKFLLAVADAKNLVNMGQAEAARKAYEQLKKDFPQIAGPDLDAFVDAEMLYCQGKFAGAMRSYDKFLEKYPLSQLYDAALDRQYAIGTAYLGGQHKVVLKVIKLKGYAEGIRIMEKVTERAGYYSPIGIKAAVAIAQNYEQREK